MPTTIRKVNGFEVRTPGGVKAKRTTRKKAEGQKRLLDAIEHDPGFVPRKQRAVKGFKAFQKGFKKATSGFGIRRRK